MCNDRKLTIRVLMIALLFPVLLVIFMGWQTYYEIEKVRENRLHNIEQIKLAKWNIVENSINDNIEKAKIQSEGVKRELTTKLLYTYSGRMDILRRDLLQKNNSEAFNIMNEVISDVYLNNKSEKNRMFIADKYGIISDKGLASSSKESRDWNTEINSKLNKELASKAVYMILTKNNKLIYWKDNLVYDTSVNIEARADEPSIESIKEAYFKYGLDGLKVYDILVPAYITNDADIFGVPDVDMHGIKNDNSKIIVIQQFNIYDAIFKHKDQLQRYDACEEIYDRETKETIYAEINDFVLSLFMTVVSFVGILVSVNLCIKWGGDDDIRGCDKG